MPTRIPTIMPKRQSTDETTLYVNACFVDMPALSRTAKSPEGGWWGWRRWWDGPDSGDGGDGDGERESDNKI